MKLYFPRTFLPDKVIVLSLKRSFSLGFSCAAFSSYGGFWMSFATIYIPGSNITAAYANGPSAELDSALGIYLITWFAITFLLL